MLNVDPKLALRLTPHLQRVLIVDPNPASSHMLSELMRSIVRGQICAAATDEKAMILARTLDPQMIFVEYNGEDHDGAAFAKAVRRSDMNCRKVPIIMISGVATAQTILGARDAGIHEFLRKPYTVKDLVKRLEVVCLKARDWIEGVGYVGPDRRRFNTGYYAGPRKRRSDARTAPDQEKILQALKIIRSASQALDTDRQQARRALGVQATDLQKAAVAVGDMKLMDAAAGLQRRLIKFDETGVLPRAELQADIAALMAFLPKEAPKDASRAA